MDHPKRLVGGGRYLTSGAPKHGGLATVYRAYDTHLERIVALKVFRTTGVSDEIIDESFRRETQALSDLRHVNIVEILGYGRDESTGEYFIAMEWVPADLANIAKAKPFRTWDSYYEAVGRQLLEAIAFAHTHSIVHRDIKPSNVLVTSDKVVKVCDFGISKIRNFLEPGVTLAHFASAAFTPPEQDDGSYSFTRDVFSFAALSVHVLSEEPPTSLASIPSCLEALSASDAVKNLLRRCLSVESPADRPQSAAVLLSELERLSSPRPALQVPLLFALTNSVRSILSVDQGIDNPDKALSFVAQDLTNASGELLPPKPEVTDPTNPRSPFSLRLLGSRYGYIAVPTAEEDKLLLTTALEYPPSRMENDRERALLLSCKLVPYGVTPTISKRNLQLLLEQLVEFAARQKEEIFERRVAQIFDTWLNLLSAKSELERQRRRNLSYSEVAAAGSAYRFALSNVDDPAALQEQDVRIDGPEGRQFSGTVVAVDEDVITVVPTERSTLDQDHIPESGQLRVDTTKSDAALDKQKAALDAVRFGRSVNPSLGAYVASPDRVPEAPPVDIEFIQAALDADKQDAVKSALAKPALLLVQGPPGTGKTTLIAELVLQTLRESPESRILLSSQTHVALDNSIERIFKVSTGDIRVIRVGSEQDVRIADSSKRLLIDRQLPDLRKSAVESGRNFIERLAQDANVDIKLVGMAIALEHLASLKERDAQVQARIAELRPILDEKRRAELDADVKADLDQELQDLMKESDVLSKDLKDAFAELPRYESDAEALKHLRECSAEETRSWANDYSPPGEQAQRLRKLLTVHTDWATRFGRSTEFRAALVASSQVVAGTCLGVMGIPGRLQIEYDLCIIDEASIATPTEVLVPMSRARRVVLLGDSKQLSPFQDPELRSGGLLEKFNLRSEDQKATLFNHLAEHLPDSLCKVLTIQHRMVPAIGNLVSECFYDGRLESSRTDSPSRLSTVLRKPVVWLSTAAHARRHSRRVGTSHENSQEVQLICTLLQRIDFLLTKSSKDTEPMSVAILSGYRAQRDRLRDAIGLQQSTWRGFSEVFVNVVDAFQGREADILIFSITRSDGKGGLGFLKEVERINVALSRGRNHLVIVGDHLFCEQASGSPNPLRLVLDYIRRNPESCALEQVVE